MFHMVLRKMMNNKWMVACLLFGTIIAIAMLSSIPMYTDGILERLLRRDMELFQQANPNIYPGRFVVTSKYNDYKAEQRGGAFIEINDKVIREVVEQMPIQAVTHTRYFLFDYLTGKDVKEITDIEDIWEKKKYYKVHAMEDIESSIEIVSGRMFTPGLQDGAYEAIVTVDGFNRMKLSIGSEYQLEDSTNGRREEPFRVRIVGVFNPNEVNVPFFYNGIDNFKDGFIIDYQTANEEFVQSENALLNQSGIYYAFDYQKLKPDELAKAISVIMSFNKSIEGMKMHVSDIPMTTIARDYLVRDQQLRTMLWVLQVPIFVMLAFYLFMVSQLIIDYEKNEISTLKSRGASNFQIFGIYFQQSAFISIIGLIIGPLLGMLICELLGSSNGFLEFIQRKRLNIGLSPGVYMYAIYALIFSMVTMLLPAMLASRQSIVEHKQKRARKRKGALWKKTMLDFILIAVSIYGLSIFQARQAEQIQNASDIGSVDPLLFIISTLFILGCGLLILRLYPYFIRFVFWLGRKIWSPVFYSSFIQVGRSGGQEQFLMLFLILTISVGLYSANAARTVNTNVEQRIMYQNGADMVVEAQWPVIRLIQPGGESMGQYYIEVPITRFNSIAGVQDANKVQIKQNISLFLPNNSETKSYMMAIQPDVFAKSTWIRDGMLPYHYYDYINALSLNQRGVILSSTYAQYGIVPGDMISFQYGTGKDHLPLTVLALVDYWPGINPYAVPNSPENHFMVLNISYLHLMRGVQPYQVWFNLSDDVTSKQLYDALLANDIEIKSLTDTRQDIITAKNDPQLQGTNGALTLGFLVTMAITAIGFIIYWILSIRGRVLQFGILRAMGMTTHKVIGMLICEQGLISGVAIIMGIIIGGIASQLYVPLLQMVYSVSQQVPSFQVRMLGEDYLKIYAFVIGMLAIGFGILGNIISRIKIHQAIKLGED